MNEEEVRALIKQKLSAKRFLHVLGVRQTAVTLAMRWGVDLQAAIYAALLHDVTKEDADQLKLCGLYDIIPPTWGERNQKLLHAVTGAAYAEKSGFSSEIANAVRWHTTGRANMSVLEKIIYLSDWVEPTRNPTEDVNKLRVLCFENIDAAMLQALNMSVNCLLEKGDWMHPDTLSARDFYLNISRQTDERKESMNEALWRQ